MNTELFFPLIITSIVIIVGWYVAHWLTSVRERNNQRREIVVSYLITAWRKLENSSQRDETFVSEIESAIADIQLFGNNRQIELAQQVAENLAYNKGANLNELLENLREELRKEMKLEKASTKIKYLRIGKNKENKL